MNHAQFGYRTRHRVPRSYESYNYIRDGGMILKRTWYPPLYPHGDGDDVNKKQIYCDKQNFVVEITFFETISYNIVNEFKKLLH